MRRTVEELIALREKRLTADLEKLRVERRRATKRAQRRKLGDGDLVKELDLTQEELRGLVLDSRDPATRKKWARLGSAKASSSPRGVVDDGEITDTSGAVAEAAE